MENNIQTRILEKITRSLKYFEDLLILVFMASIIASIYFFIATNRITIIGGVPVIEVANTVIAVTMIYFTFFALILGFLWPIVHSLSELLGFNNKSKKINNIKMKYVLSFAATICFGLLSAIFWFLSASTGVEKEWYTYYYSLPEYQVVPPPNNYATLASITLVVYFIALLYTSTIIATVFSNMSEYLGVRSPIVFITVIVLKYILSVLYVSVRLTRIAIIPVILLSVALIYIVHLMINDIKQQWNSNKYKT